MISGEVLKYLKGEHVVIFQKRDGPLNRQVCLTTPWNSTLVKLFTFRDRLVGRLAIEL